MGLGPHTHPKSDITGDAYKRSGMSYETYSRIFGGSNAVVLASGILTLVGIELPRGIVVSTITFHSGTTALGTGTNQWFSLYDSARGKLAVTADDTSTAWAANSEKTLTLSAPFTTTYAGLHYLGCTTVVSAGSSPTLMAMAVGGSGAFPTRAPAVAGLSTSGLTNPASAPSTAAALGAIAGVPWGAVA